MKDIPDIHPCTIVNDRYSGVYSGGRWLAFPLDFYDTPEAIDAGDIECGSFWRHYLGRVGRGDTPTAALKDLAKQGAE